MTTTLQIRRLTYADLPQVIALERRAFTTPWSLAMFVLELSKPTGICLAALRGERLVGYLVCSRYDTVWHLMNVAVDDRLRRQGIADVLMDRLFALADAPGVQYTLEVRTSNGPAIRLYEKLGFAAAGRRRGYYHDNREDAVIMWRTAPDLPAGDRPWDVGDSSLDAGDGPRAPGDGRSERVASRRQARGGSQRPDRA